MNKKTFHDLYNYLFLEENITDFERHSILTFISKKHLKEK
jgi:hypothetical protein